MLNHSVKNRRKYKTMPLPLEQQFVRSDMLQIEQESGLTWGENLDFLYLGTEEKEDPCANLLGMTDEDVAAAKAAWAAADAAAKAAAAAAAATEVVAESTAESIPAEGAEPISKVVLNTGQDDPEPGGDGAVADVVVAAEVSADLSADKSAQATSELAPDSLEQDLSGALAFSPERNVEQMDMYCGELPQPPDAQDESSQSAPSIDNGINWAWQKLANMEAQFVESREGGADGECWQFDPHSESAGADDENEPDPGPYEVAQDQASLQERDLAAGDEEPSIANFGRTRRHQQRCQNFRFTMVDPSAEMATEVAAAEDAAEGAAEGAAACQHLDQYFVELTQSFDKGYERQAFYNLMVNLGPDIRLALVDPDVTEIMVNSDGQIFIEMVKTGMRHIGALSSESAQAVIRILASLESKELNMEHPILSGEIPRLNARFEGLLPPLVVAPVFSIRRHHFQNLSLDQLFKTGMLTAEQHQVLLEALKEHFSIVVCGATGSGKTTLLNGLICEIAKTFPQERIITIEDTPELRITSYNKLNLYTSDHVDMSSLVRSSLRLRPDRLIVGEVRGAEALDLLDAFSTGHRGGLTSIHAGSIDQALNRLTLLVSRHPKAPRLIEPTVGDAIDLLVVVQRMPYRHVCHMAKLNGYRNQAFSYNEIDF